MLFLQEGNEICFCHNLHQGLVGVEVLALVISLVVTEHHLQMRNTALLRQLVGLIVILPPNGQILLLCMPVLGLKNKAIKPFTGVKF